MSQNSPTNKPKSSLAAMVLIPCVILVFVSVSPWLSIPHPLFWHDSQTQIAARADCLCRSYMARRHKLQQELLLPSQDSMTWSQNNHPAELRNDFFPLGVVSPHLPGEIFRAILVIFSQF